MLNVGVEEDIWVSEWVQDMKCVGYGYTEGGVCVFSSRRRHTRLRRDWSSDVCSSDLGEAQVEDRNLGVCRLDIGALDEGHSPVNHEKNMADRKSVV